MTVKEIFLTQGKIAIVDEADYELVNSLKWYYAARTGRFKHLPGYAVRNWRFEDGSRRTVFLHDFLMGSKPGQKVTFINSETLDCRRENLRFATKVEIQRHQRIQTNKSLQFKGVDFNKKANVFRARIQISGKTHMLGFFPTDVEAAQAYDAAARKHFGELAAVNFADENELTCLKRR